MTRRNEKRSISEMTEGTSYTRLIAGTLIFLAGAGITGADIYTNGKLTGMLHAAADQSANQLVCILCIALALMTFAVTCQKYILERK